MNTADLLSRSPTLQQQSNEKYGCGKKIPVPCERIVANATTRAVSVGTLRTPLISPRETVSFFSARWMHKERTNATKLCGASAIHRERSPFDCPRVPDEPTQPEHRRVSSSRLLQCAAMRTSLMKRCQRFHAARNEYTRACSLASASVTAVVRFCFARYNNPSACGRKRTQGNTEAVNFRQ